MNDVSFDTLARDTLAPQGRRFALKALGLALGAVAVAPLTAYAKNTNGGNNKNRNRKRNRKQGRNDQECPPEDCTAEAQQAVAIACQAQLAQCEQQFREICSDNDDPGDEAACLESFLSCCPPLTSCDFAAFSTCLFGKLI